MISCLVAKNQNGLRMLRPERCAQIENEWKRLDRLRERMNVLNTASREARRGWVKGPWDLGTATGLRRIVTPAVSKEGYPVQSSNFRFGPKTSKSLWLIWIEMGGPLSCPIPMSRAVPRGSQEREVGLQCPASLAQSPFPPPPPPGFRRRFLPASPFCLDTCRWFPGETNNSGASEPRGLGASERCWTSTAPGSSFRCRSAPCASWKAGSGGSRGKTGGSGSVFFWESDTPKMGAAAVFPH